MLSISSKLFRLTLQRIHVFNGKSREISIDGSRPKLTAMAEKVSGKQPIRIRVKSDSVEMRFRRDDMEILDMKLDINMIDDMEMNLEFM